MGRRGIRCSCVSSTRAGPIATPGDALAEEILAHCGRELPTYKTPRSVDFVEEIPRSEAGKIVRRELRDRYRT